MSDTQIMKDFLGLGRPKLETLPVDPRWTFIEAMTHLTARHNPTSRLHNQGRNRMIEAWATMIGGKRATQELSQAFERYGSWTAMAKDLRTTTKTLKHYETLFATLPEPHQVFSGFGLSLFFLGHLKPLERRAVEDIKNVVLHEQSDCRLTRFEEVQGGTVLRFSGGTTQELEQLAAAFVGLLWDEREQESVPGTATVPGLLHQVMNRLARLELAMPGEDVQEWMSDLAAAHLSAKDRQLVQTGGQKILKLTAKVLSKKALSKIGLDTLLDE